MEAEGIAVCLISDGLLGKVSPRMDFSNIAKKEKTQVVARNLDYFIASVNKNLKGRIKAK